MKEVQSEVLARQVGPASYAGHGNVVGVATAGVHPGRPFEHSSHARAHISRAIC